jgi:hypothetical protein
LMKLLLSRLMFLQVERADMDCQPHIAPTLINRSCSKLTCTHGGRSPSSMSVWLFAPASFLRKSNLPTPKQTANDGYSGSINT